MTFPQLLKLNHLIEGFEGVSAMDDGLNCDEHKDSASAPCFYNGNEGLAGPSKLADHCTNDDDPSNMEDEGNTGNTLPTEAEINTRNALASEIKGPYEYELFSIMIHSGSATGGHYYAYIKNFKDGGWYSFNDQLVSTITFEDIRKTYGGSVTSRGYYSSSYTSSVNAYMLVYRQIDKIRNEEVIEQHNFPEHIKRELQNIKDREEEEMRQRELDKLTCKIKLYCFHPVQQKQLECKFEIHKDTTLREATTLAWKQMDLEGVLPRDCVRLVKYDDYNEYIDRSYSLEEEDCTMEDVLDGCKISYLFDLLLEIKHPQEIFQVYYPGGIMIKPYLVEIVSETIEGPLRIHRAYSTDTVGDLKTAIAQSLSLPADCSNYVIERYNNELRPLFSNDSTLRQENFPKSVKLFMECSGLEPWDDEEIDLQQRFRGSRFHKVLDRFQNTIRLIVALPAPIADKSYLTSPVEADGESDEGLGDSEDTDEAARSCHSDLTSGVHSDCSQPVGSPTSNTLRDASGASPSSVGASPATEKESTVDTVPVDPSGAGDNWNLNGRVGPDGESSTSGAGDDGASSLDSSSTVTSSTSTVTPCEHPPERSASLDIDFDELPARPRSWPDGAEAWSSVHPTTHGTKETKFTTESVVAFEEDTKDTNAQELDYQRYFSASVNVDAQSKANYLTAYVDKRMTYRSFKRALEPYVGCTSNNFKLFRQYSSQQELECTRLSDTLFSLMDDVHLTVRFGRALKKGEYRVKIYLLQLDQPETSKYVTEIVLSKRVTVSQAKGIVCEELGRQCDINLPIQHMRLRKKMWRTPADIYSDNMKFDFDIPLLPTSELFVEEVQPPRLTELPHRGAVAVYIKRWYPASYQLGPMQEVVIHNNTIEELKEKISELSQIPCENIEFAKGKGTFPCEVPVLQITSGLDWNPSVVQTDCWPLSLTDDGCVLYFRDSREELGELSDDKKKELEQKENIRLANSKSSYSGRYNYSRKERALKIYTDDTPDRAVARNNSPVTLTSPTVEGLSLDTDSLD